MWSIPSFFQHHLTLTIFCVLLDTTSSADATKSSSNMLNIRRWYPTRWIISVNLHSLYKDCLEFLQVSNNMVYWFLKNKEWSPPKFLKKSFARKARLYYLRDLFFGKNSDLLGEVLKVISLIVQNCNCSQNYAGDLILFSIYAALFHIKLTGCKCSDLDSIILFNIDVPQFTHCKFLIDLCGYI